MTPLNALASLFFDFFITKVHNRHSTFSYPWSYLIFSITQELSGDFPGGPAVKNPPSNAGDMSSIPGQGTEIPRAAGQLSFCAATTEPTCSGAWLPQEKSLHISSAKVPHVATETQHSQK